MTQDEIIRMAREAGLGEPVNHDQWDADLPRLERFAALVADHEREKAKAVFEELEREVKAELINAINGAVELEREACACLFEIEQELSEWPKYILEQCAAAIRAREKNDN